MPKNSKDQSSKTLIAKYNFEFRYVLPHFYLKSSYIYLGLLMNIFILPLQKVVLQGMYIDIESNRSL